jgi:hypothetical protein
MATEYTDAVRKGCSFEQFVWSCARAFCRDEVLAWRLASFRIMVCERVEARPLLVVYGSGDDE